MKDKVRYEVSRVLRDANGRKSWTIPHASAASRSEAREIAKRDLQHWIIIERKVVETSDEQKDF